MELSPDLFPNRFAEANLIVNIFVGNFGKKVR
jgi:hypothetical protein